MSIHKNDIKKMWQDAANQRNATNPDPHVTRKDDKKKHDEAMRVRDKSVKDWWKKKIDDTNARMAEKYKKKGI